MRPDDSEEPLDALPATPEGGLASHLFTPGTAALTLALLAVAAAVVVPLLPTPTTKIAGVFVAVCAATGGGLVAFIGFVVGLVRGRDRIASAAGGVVSMVAFVLLGVSIVTVTREIQHANKSPDPFYRVGEVERIDRPRRIDEGKKSDGPITLNDASELSRFVPTPGDEYLVPVTGRTTGRVWGSGPYTTDSDVATAAVHAGLLKAGQTGRLRVRVIDGREQFPASAANGVESSSWDRYPTALTLELAAADPLPKPATRPVPPTTRPTPGVLNEPRDLTAYTERIGETVLIDVTGADFGSVWGSGPYTLDSSVGRAAVHAGLLKVGERGRLRVTIVKGLDSFPSSTANGVTTSAWSSYPAAFRLANANGAVPDRPTATRKEPTRQATVEVEWKGAWYPAVIVEKKGDKSLIHYVGWGDSWDEWVGPDRIRPLKK